MTIREMKRKSIYIITRFIKYIEENSYEKIYLYNFMPDFDVKYMYHEEDEDDGVCWVQFLSDDEDKLDDMDNYDFSNDSAHEIIYFYSCKYSDLFSEEPEILGSYSIVYTRQNDGWQILYAPDGDIIFKTSMALSLECGLQEIYYDNNDNIIAKYSGYNQVNEKSLFEKADGQIINEDELRTLLENLSPNDVLEGCI